MIAALIAACLPAGNASGEAHNDLYAQTIFSSTTAENPDSVATPTKGGIAASGQDEQWPEAFYLSLPELELPVAWSEYGETVFVKVPAQLMPTLTGKEYYGTEYTAARFPEAGGLRFILFSYEEENGDNATELAVYRSGERKPSDGMDLYSVREIGGGANTLVMTFAIDESHMVTLTSVYNGQGTDDANITVVFQREYYTPFPDGTFRPADGSWDTVSYTEGAPYEFTVETTRHNPDGSHEHKTQKQYYMVDGDGRLVETDGPGKDKDPARREGRNRS